MGTIDINFEIGFPAPARLVDRLRGGTILRHAARVQLGFTAPRGALGDPAPGATLSGLLTRWFVELGPAGALTQDSTPDDRPEATASGALAARATTASDSPRTGAVRWV